MDRRRSLPRVESGVVLVILAAFIGAVPLPGVVIGLVLAIVLFAVSYGRIELVREVAFGETYRSNVDRPPGEQTLLGVERSRPDPPRERVRVLRIGQQPARAHPQRVETEPPRFLVVDLRRVTGVDSSAVVSFVKVVHLAETTAFRLVFTGASEPVRRQLERGGVVASEGIVRFEPDLDRGLQWSEEGLLRVAGPDGTVVEGVPVGNGLDAGTEG